MSDDTRITVHYGPGITVSWLLRITADAEEEPTYMSVKSMLELEQAIDARLSGHRNDITRSVHALSGRDFELRDGRTIAFSWDLVVNDWLCADCGVDTDAIAEFYMVHDDLWRGIVDDVTCQLCISCVEQRLGRELTAADFPARPINTNSDYLRSARLIARLTSSPQS